MVPAMCVRIIGRSGAAALIIIASSLAMAPVFAAADDEVRLKPIATYTIDRNISGKKGKPAKDLSGIACASPDASGSRPCLVINDESSFAQLVTLHDRGMVAGGIVPLIGETPPPPPPVSGKPPIVACPKGPAEKLFEEFDGEGVAYRRSSGSAESTFYVAGSHGCSRTKAKFRLSSFLLARVGVDDHGRAGTAELTYRLSDALRSTPPVGQFFGKSLEAEAQGLNIEGAAVADETLLFGLRSPSLNGEAFIVASRISDLFAPGQAETPIAARTPLRLALGRNVGIRDLASLPDGRLLVLSGPAQGQCDVPFALWFVDAPLADPPSGPFKLGLLEDVFEDDQVKNEWRRCVAGRDRNAEDTRAKAEGITVLSSNRSQLRLLVLFDGLLNGGGREYAVNLPDRK
jgi:hypothetical protein